MLISIPILAQMILDHPVKFAAMTGIILMGPLLTIRDVQSIQPLTQSSGVQLLYANVSID